MSTVKIPAGLRGSIYRTGKNSYRLQLPLGRNAKGEYENKRETIRGTEQDALNLLTRWNCATDSRHSRPRRRRTG